MKRLLRNICIVFCVGLILIPLYLNSRTPDTNRLSDDESGTLTVTVANLGKADAILLQSGEHAMLIDAGYEKSSDDLLALLEKLREESLRALREITSFGRYPDLSACAHLREKLDFELDQMRQQAALLKTRRSRRSLAWQTGCAQLAGRMVQEVTALGMMDSFGRVSEENKKRLDTLDSAQEISLPENSLQVPAADSVQDTVMNYHIACYCQAYAYLTQLLPLWKDEEPEQAAKQGEETSNEKARQGSITAGAD